MSNFKKFEEVLLPDPRIKMFKRIKVENNTTTSIELKEMYDEVAAIYLTGHPPERIAREFDKAKNLIVYSWFVYEFAMSAIFQAHSTLEYALREKFEIESITLKELTGLRKLLSEAVARGWIRDGGFPHVVQNARRRQESETLWPKGVTQIPFDPNATEYCQILIETKPRIRNDLAHGSSTLLPPGYALFEIEICARIIDQLFP